MTKAQKDEYWMNCIQQCRVSGLSDYAWCNKNGISISSFYYNIKRLRSKAQTELTREYDTFGLAYVIPQCISKYENYQLHKLLSPLSKNETYQFAYH